MLQAACVKRPEDVTQQLKLRNFTQIFQETIVASKRSFLENYFKFRTKSCIKVYPRPCGPRPRQKHSHLSGDGRRRTNDNR